jgi:hypothetical protein
MVAPMSRTLIEPLSLEDQQTAREIEACFGKHLDAAAYLNVSPMTLAKGIAGMKLSKQSLDKLRAAIATHRASGTQGAGAAA